MRGPVYFFVSGWFYLYVVHCTQFYWNMLSSSLCGARQRTNQGCLNRNMCLSLWTLWPKTLPVKSRNFSTFTQCISILQALFVNKIYPDTCHPGFSSWIPHLALANQRLAARYSLSLPWGPDEVDLQLGKGGHAWHKRQGVKYEEGKRSLCLAENIKEQHERPFQARKKKMPRPSPIAHFHVHQCGY